MSTIKVFRIDAQDHGDNEDRRAAFEAARQALCEQFDAWWREHPDVRIVAATLSEYHGHYWNDSDQTVKLMVLFS